MDGIGEAVFEDKMSDIQKSVLKSEHVYDAKVVYFMSRDWIWREHGLGTWDVSEKSTDTKESSKQPVDRNKWKNIKSRSLWIQRSQDAKTEKQMKSANNQMKDL